MIEKETNYKNAEEEGGLFELKAREGDGHKKDMEKVERLESMLGSFFMIRHPMQNVKMFVLFCY